MPTIWRWLWRWLRFPVAIVAAVCVAAVVWLAWLLSGQRYQQLLTEQLSAQLSAEVRVASSRLSLQHGLGIQLDSVAVRRGAGAEPFFSAGRIEVLLDFAALLHGNLLFRHIVCTNPHLRLPEGKNTIAALFARPPAVPGQPEPNGQWSGRWPSPTLALRQLHWQDGEIVYSAKPPGVSFLLTHTDAMLRYAVETGLTVRLSAALGHNGEMGKIALQAAAPTWEDQMSPSQIPWQGEIQLSSVKAQQVGRALGVGWPAMTLDFHGRHQGKWDGPLELTGDMKVEGLQVGEVRVREGKAKVTKLHWAGLGDAPFSVASLMPALGAELHIEALKGEVGRGNLPVTLQKGDITLRNGEVAANGIAGTWGARSQITEATGIFKNLLASQGPTLDLRVVADVDLEEWTAQALTTYADTLPPGFSQYFAQPQGRALMQLGLQASGARALNYSGEVTFQQAGFHVPQWNLNITDVGGQVKLTRGAVITDALTFRFGESSVRMQGGVRDYLTSRPKPDLHLTFAAVRDQDLVPFIPSGKLLPQNGHVSGQIGVTFPPQGEEVQVDGRVALHRIRLDLLDFLQPLDVIDGEMAWQGQSGTFVVSQGRFPGGEFTGRGRLLSFAPLHLEVSADFGEVDLASALALGKPADTSPKESNRSVRADITCGRLTYKAMQVEGLRLSCHWHDRQADLRVAEARAQGGTIQGDAVLWPDSDAMFIAPQLVNVNLSGFLNALAAPSELLTGRLDGDGKIYMPDWRRWDDLASWDAVLALSVKDGIARRVPILVRLWSALSLQGLLSFQFPSFPREGLAFSSLSGNFALGKGLAVTKNVSLDSSAVRVDARGAINLVQRTVDLRADLVPLHGITSSMAKVPLAGGLLARGANLLTTLPFRVSGPYDDPTVTPLLVDMGKR